LPQDRYRLLDVHPGSEVFVSPRQVRVFAVDEMEAVRDGSHI
jgi:hypothetical protein